MKANEFLTKKMWNRLTTLNKIMFISHLYLPEARRSTSYESALHILRYKQTIYASWLLFGIFAEKIMRKNDWDWSTVIHRFHNDTEANMEFKYPHIGIFEYLQKLNKSSNKGEQVDG